MNNNSQDENAVRVWVDTDFGFDDLWALLVLTKLNIQIDGVSLVSGNTPLPQVTRNAEASICTFGFDWPLYAGADKPLQREPETAEHILGRYGMCSRGLFLPYSESHSAANLHAESAVEALAHWLEGDALHHILALGPLTNLGLLLMRHPEAVAKIHQITWLGGSRGRGNQTAYAEFNALADPEALSVVANSNLPFRIIDLELCRQVSFSEDNMPVMNGTHQDLIADLLGGYLDIALQRGRMAMSIYDPLAALSIGMPELFNFLPSALEVQLAQDAEYGRTMMDLSANSENSATSIAVSVDCEKARNNCLSALIDA